MELLKHKPFWRRVNRGFLVSMVLLAAVLIYVLVTQLMLIPQRRQLADLANQAGDAIMSVENLSEPGTPDAQRKAVYLEGLMGDLKPLFSEDSEYVSAAAQQAVQSLYDRMGTDQRITSQQRSESKMVACTIDEDVASVTMENTYTVNGELYNARNDEITSVEGASQTLYFNLTFKKADGSWNIYRISSVGVSNAMLDGGRY